MSDPLSVSTIGGYRSAIVDLYTNANLVMEAETKVALTRALDGYDKIITELKRKGLMKMSEEKRPISGSGYNMLGEKIMKSSVVRTETNVVAGRGSTSIFSWTFFVIMWNLMSRADSVSNMMLQHIYWSGDALIIHEHGGKADKKDESNYEKHIYANPLQPEVCPILALAVMIFTAEYRPSGGKQQLFIGTDSKGRFAHLLQKLVHGLTEAELKQLGCEVEDVGMHSERKGSGTYCLGQVGGPTPVHYSRATKALKVMEDLMFGNGENPETISSLSSPESDVLFHRFFLLLIQKMFDDGVNLTQKDELSYGTVYNLLNRNDVDVE